jgi:hypothetical protein
MHLPQLDLDPAPLRIVAEPTLSIHMSGYLRMQTPCSKPIQAIFDLLTADLKRNPANVEEIAAEAGREGGKAAQALNQVLMNSPQLRQVSSQIGLSYAIVQGKLHYMYMLPVRSV